MLLRSPLQANMYDGTRLLRGTSGVTVVRIELLDDAEVCELLDQLGVCLHLDGLVRAAPRRGRGAAVQPAEG